jgi:hypothetical protein
MPRDGRLNPVNFGDIQSEADDQFVLPVDPERPRGNLIVMRTCMNSRLYL